MARIQLKWGQDAGFQEKVRPFKAKADLSDHGVRGKLREGELGFSRALTKREAKRDAADGIPPSEALTEDQWSEREQIVAERAEDLRRGLTTWFRATAGEARDFIGAQTPHPIRPERIEDAVTSDVAELRQYEAEDAAQAKQAHDDAIAELGAFKDSHRGRIGNRTPDIKKNVEQTLAVLLAIMILEGGFNALLFKDAQGSGLLGGVLVAFGVSAVNVAFGVVAGFFGLRFALNHAKIPMRAFGAAIASVFIVLGLFLNLFVAHFRDAVEAGLHSATSASAFSMFSIPPGEVVASMVPNVFGLSSLVALGLLLIGLAVFAVAVYEGYDRLSDRYPGYGRVWRKERLAYERGQQVVDTARQDLSDYFTACRAWCDEQQTRHVAARREIDRAMTLLEARREEAAAIAGKAGDQERSLKIAYRQAHRRMRNTLRETLGEQAATPAYFDEIVTPRTAELSYDGERETAASARETIDANITALDASRRWLEAYIQQNTESFADLNASVKGMDARGQQVALRQGLDADEGGAPKAKPARKRDAA